MTLSDAVRWFQEHLGFINRLPSWLNELLSGFLCVWVAYALLFVVGHIFKVHALILFVFPLALVMSEFYEHYLDPWGYRPQDVVERVRGVVLIMFIVQLVKAL